MGTIKTAVSIEESLFGEAEALARELRVPRSRVFSRALEEFVARHRNRRLLASIDAALSDTPEAAEDTLRGTMRRTHRRIVEGEW